ncbi:MAG: hypothetical protein IJW13_02210 [Clostridia bacterium]|nr:hypothetical protein [Clostridia bacterium]
MINNEKQYKRSNTRYQEDFIDYEPGMTASRNAYVEDDYGIPVRENTRNSAADFEQMIDQGPVRHYDDDLFPTTTTMQFGGKDRSYIYEDLNERESVAEDEEEASYKINTKGKIMIAVYALVVLTIFTLIIMNTRLIKNMNASISEQEARIEALMEENQELMNEYEFVQSDEEVIRRAEEMGMVVNG